MSKDTHKDFLHRENIRAFQERLTSETDPGMRGLLIQLLAEERARKRSLPKPLTSVVGANNASLASFASTNAVISEISESLSLTPTAVAGVTLYDRLRIHLHPSQIFRWVRKRQGSGRELP